MQKSAHHFKEDLRTSDSPSKISPYGICAILCIVVTAGMGIYLSLSRPAIRVVLFVLLSLVSVVFLWLWYRSNRNNPLMCEAFASRVFPIVFFVLGMSYLLFFPPGTIPDEPYHYGVSYEYANLLDPNMDGREMRAEDVKFVGDENLFSIAITPSFWKAQKEGLPFFATQTGKLEDEEAIHALKMPSRIDPSGNPVQVKLFPALGIALGKALNLSAWVTFYMGRLFSFALAFILVVLAVRLTPVGRKTMMTVALLPMTLHLMGSYSYDSAIIGYSFLLISLFLRLFFGEGRASRGLLWGSLALAVLLAPCKIVYYPLCLLALAVPKDRFGSERERNLWKICMLVIPILVLMVPNIGRLLNMSGVSREAASIDTREGETGRFYAIADLLGRPFDAALMLLRTLYVNSDFYVSSLVGGSLGWFQLGLMAKDIQVFLLLLLLGLAALPSIDDERTLSTKSRMVSIVSIILGAIGIFMSMWLGWTFTTDDVINGVQGRYFLPYLPVFLMAIRSKFMSASIDLGQIITMVFACHNLLYLAQTAFVVLGG